MYDFLNQIQSSFSVKIKEKDDCIYILCPSNLSPKICDILFSKFDYIFSGIILDRDDMGWKLYYIFFKAHKVVLVEVSSSRAIPIFHSISPYIHGADWHEREIEDLFGIRFQGHPKLGNFVLHDDVWPEGVAPMMHKDFPDPSFDYWQDLPPQRLLDAKGAFVMPVGPVFSGEAESVHFQIETIGEEIVRCYPRLFYKYRAVEKKAELMEIDRVIFLCERINGKSAFSSALCLCQAVEDICGITPPPRAQVLRVFFCELERIRHHIGVIEGICSSTGLWIASNAMGILEERVLRLCCTLTGHRYLFGMAIAGGVSKDISSETLKEASEELERVFLEFKEIEDLLVSTSSFLDRIEEVGVLNRSQVRDYAMVGPVARGCEIINDMRVVRPYLLYSHINFGIPTEREGDGYARLRVFCAEIEQSLRIIKEIIQDIPGGPVAITPEYRAGSGVGAVEAPGGANIQWVRIDEGGRVLRYRIIPPSFMNWHGFHNAVEGFAFQDFPIILATFGLSVAENDR